MLVLWLVVKSLGTSKVLDWLTLGLPVETLSLFSHSVYLPTFLQDSWTPSIVCVSLGLFLLVVGWSLSEESWHSNRVLVVSDIGSCVLDGFQFEQVIGRLFPQSLLHLFPALLVGRTHFGSKVLWVGCCSYPCTISPAWLQEVATSGSILPTARNLKSTPWTSWGLLL